MSTTTGAIGMHHRIRSRNWPNGGTVGAPQRDVGSPLPLEAYQGTPLVVGNARNLMVELDRAFDRTQAYVDRSLPQQVLAYTSALPRWRKNRSRCIAPSDWHTGTPLAEFGG